MDIKDSDEIIAQALNVLQKRSIDGYEIFLDQSSHFSVESKEGKVDTLEASHSGGMAFRILNHQRIGFSYTTFSNPSHSIRQDFLGQLENR